VALPPEALRYLLDEDVHPEAAAAARGLGLNVVSVHEVGRSGLSDAEQLRFAAADGRVFVTRNRDDYIMLTVEAFRAGAPHAGLLILPYTLSNRRPADVAHALQRWHEGRRDSGDMAYRIDFVK
jgi:hypothetical protein